MTNKKEKIEAAIILSSFLETIGFYNGIWEFNYSQNEHINNIDNVLTINYQINNEYMSLGGYSGMDFTKLKSSDDTILMISVIEALLKDSKEIDFINSYVKYFDKLKEKERYAGKQTINSISQQKKYLNSKKKAPFLDNYYYDYDMGGNGAAIRSGPIGIMYHNNLDKLIDISIMSSRLTHNIPIGYLGGFVSALFASYAFKNINPCEWINLLIELVETNKIKDYIHSTTIDTIHDTDIDNYFSYWFKYKEHRHDDIVNYRFKSTFSYAYTRFNDLSSYIPSNYFKSGKKENWSYLGASGIDSVIYAYDSLLMSMKINEKGQIDSNYKIDFNSLIFYGCLHVGDSDSTGAILGFWYGALVGYDNNDILKKQIKKLEFYDSLSKLTNLFNKVH